MDAVRVVIHAPFGGRVNAPWGMALANRVREWLAEQGRAARVGAELRAAGADDRRRHHAPAAESARLASDRRAARSHAGRSRAARARRGRRVVAVRRALPNERGARAAAAARQSAPAHAALAAAPQGARSAPGGAGVSVVSDSRRDLSRRAAGRVRHAGAARVSSTSSRRARSDCASVETEMPSPFAASLQFGFVMDWMYADDAPRAEQRAALLSLDRALLDELMGGEGADDSTLAMLETMLARRRGTAPGARARTADELAVLIDRARRSHARRAARSRRAGRGGSPRRSDRSSCSIAAARSGSTCPTATGADAAAHHPHRELSRATSRRSARMPSRRSTPGRRSIRRRRRRAPGGAQRARDHAAGRATRAPRALRLARRRGLGRRRAGALRLRREWVEERLDEWTRTGRLVRGTFGGDAATPRWCSRRLLEQARRRELAQARKQIEAVDLGRFSRFRAAVAARRIRPRASTARTARRASIRQMYGLARPAEQWEREYLPARVDDYDPTRCRA